MRFSPGRILLPLVLLLLGGALRAQAQTGGVAGTIRDAATSAPIPGVLVEAVDAGGRTVAAARSDEIGVYRLSGLAPGRYVLVVSRVDVEPRRVDVEVNAGQTSRVSVSVGTGNVRLDPVVVSASKRPEKAVDAPARVEVVSEAQIEARPAVTPVEHLRNVPGVDVASTGVQSSNVVARGFNNIFSGALHALTDYRIASVPSLRVNFLHFTPANNQDIQRMEVVLGPGAALYGPNTANGILHILTKSPLDDQGTTVAVSGGERNLLHGEFRSAHLLHSNLGFKLSGQYLRADEWEYTDPAEVAEVGRFRCAVDPTGCTAAQVGAAQFARRDLARAVGIDSAASVVRIGRIGQRDFEVERLGGEARADWRVSSGLNAVVQAGLTQSNGIELTGLGAGQAQDWRYSYLQARTTYRRLFAQVYFNQSDAGETFLLRNGAPIVDRSNLLVAQLQHGASFWDGRQSFTYGGDYLRTTPVTDGTINGWYEDRDGTDELGAYLQSETRITDQLELVLAGRVDVHSALPDPVFSPRAALLLKPTEGQTLRVAFNRAFSTPSSLNQFLDLGSALPGNDPRTNQLRQLGYSLRIQGTGDEGFTLRGPDGSYQVRSPFNPDPAALVPATSADLLPLAVGVVAQGAAARGAPLSQQFLNYLLSLRPTAAQVGLNYFDISANRTGALADLALSEINPIRESATTTLEVGYKGLLGTRFLVAADVWWSRMEDLVTPLTIQTPLVLLNGPQLAQYLVPRFMADLGMSQAQATATALSLIGDAQNPGLASIPVGVISSADVDARGGQLLVTYVNVDERLELWGTDISATMLISDEWVISGSTSYASDDVFHTRRAGIVTLNAPQWKRNLAVSYDNDDTGLFGEARMRHSSAFPVKSGVYEGTACINRTGVPTPLEEACIESYTLFDLNLGYRLPMVPGATVQLTAQNLLDEDYRPFPGAPDIGRMLIARVRFDF
ncbi:MAG TPA: TonB-dependent receptor [Longimicrobium sp.]|nr:TonB-dependent receptor [Longimicrobium sp.]